MDTYLSLSRDTNKPLLVVGKRYDGWSSPLTYGSVSGWVELTFGVLNNLSIISFHHGDAGVSGTEINSNDAAHDEWGV